MCVSLAPFPILSAAGVDLERYETVLSCVPALPFTQPHVGVDLHSPFLGFTILLGILRIQFSLSLSLSLSVRGLIPHHPQDLHPFTIFCTFALSSNFSSVPFTFKKTLDNLVGPPERKSQFLPPAWAKHCSPPATPRPRPCLPKRQKTPPRFQRSAPVHVSHRQRVSLRCSCWGCWGQGRNFLLVERAALAHGSDGHNKQGNHTTTAQTCT